MQASSDVKNLKKLTPANIDYINNKYFPLFLRVVKDENKKQTLNSYATN